MGYRMAILFMRECVALCWYSAIRAQGIRSQGLDQVSLFESKWHWHSPRCQRC